MGEAAEDSILDGMAYDNLLDIADDDCYEPIGGWQGATRRYGIDNEPYPRSVKPKRRIMNTTARAPRTPSSTQPAQIVSPATKVFSLADITNKAKPSPNRYGCYAPIGFGKSSLFAYSPSPIYLTTRGETGLQKLIETGQLPETPHFPELISWLDILAAIKFLRTEEHSYKTMVLDTANGAERLMHEFVAERDFSGDWTDRGFMGYMRGYEVSLADWRMFLNSLDDLQRERNMTIVFLFHSRVKTFKNPAGPDFDRYAPELHEKTWALTRGWLDCILFGNFEVAVRGGSKVVDPMKKGKAADIAPRILYTNSDNPTYDAKNRLGLPDDIELGDSAEEAWQNFATALKESRKVATQ